MAALGVRSREASLVQIDGPAETSERIKSTNSGHKMQERHDAELPHWCRREIRHQRMALCSGPRSLSQEEWLGARPAAERRSVMQRKPIILRSLLYGATGLSVIILVITVALWRISERNLRNGSPIVNFAQWGDGASGSRRTVLLGLGDMSFYTQWDERPLPAGAAHGQTVYDYNSDILGFRWSQDFYRPLDSKDRPMPGVFGRSRGFSVPLGWLLLISLVLPLRPLVLRVVRQATLARWRTSRGLCAHCGYDLRATPDRCPECGYEVRRGGAAA